MALTAAIVLLVASVACQSSARADLLQKLGRVEEARMEFERAADLTQNARQRDQLLARAAKCMEVHR